MAPLLPYFPQIYYPQIIIINRWRRKWQPTPVFLPGKSYGLRSLEGYSPRGPRVGQD